jgi:hypothetical protein
LVIVPSLNWLLSHWRAFVPGMTGGRGALSSVNDLSIIALANNTELIEELLKQAKFFGVLVFLEGEVLGDIPKLGASLSLLKTGSCRTLAPRCY